MGMATRAAHYIDTLLLVVVMRGHAGLLLGRYLVLGFGKLDTCLRVGCIVCRWMVLVSVLMVGVWLHFSGGLLELLLVMML